MVLILTKMHQSLSVSILNHILNHNWTIATNIRTKKQTSYSFIAQSPFTHVSLSFICIFRRCFISSLEKKVSPKIVEFQSGYHVFRVVFLVLFLGVNFIIFVYVSGRFLSFFLSFFFVFLLFFFFVNEFTVILSELIIVCSCHCLLLFLHIPDTWCLELVKGFLVKVVIVSSSITVLEDKKKVSFNQHQKNGERCLDENLFN